MIWSTLTDLSGLGGVGIESWVTLLLCSVKLTTEFSLSFWYEEWTFIRVKWSLVICLVIFFKSNLGFTTRSLLCFHNVMIGLSWSVWFWVQRKIMLCYANKQGPWVCVNFFFYLPNSLSCSLWPSPSKWKTRWVDSSTFMMRQQVQQFSAFLKTGKINLRQSVLSLVLLQFAHIYSFKKNDVIVILFALHSAEKLDAGSTEEPTSRAILRHSPACQW